MPFVLVALAATVFFAVSASPAQAADNSWVDVVGTAGFEEAKGVATDASGVYVVGESEQPLQNETGAGNVFVMKFAFDGTVLWTTRVGTWTNTGGGAYDVGEGVAVDGTGVYVTGSTALTFPGEPAHQSRDVFLARLELTGSLDWVRELGAWNIDDSRGIALNSEAVFYTGIAGYGGNFSLPPGYTSEAGAVFVAKYYRNGTLGWVHQFGAGADYGGAIDADAEGVVVGGLEGSHSYLRKYSNGGSVLWNTSFGSSSYDYLYGVGLAATGVCAGGFTAGTFAGPRASGSGAAYVAWFLPNGSMEWIHQFPEGAVGAVTCDGTWIVTAGSTGPAGDGFVRNFDLTGAQVFNASFGSTGGDFPESVARGPSGGLYVAGYADGAFANVTPGGGRDGFLVHPDLPPLASFVAAPADATIGDVISLDASNSSDRDENAAFLDMRWDFEDDGVFDTAFGATRTVRHTYAFAGTYHVRLEVRDLAGFTANASAVVTILPPPPQVTAAAAPLSGEVPLDVAFTSSAAGGGGPVWYNWEFGDGNTSTQANPTHTYRIPGHFLANLTFSDSLGRTAVAHLEINVSAPPLSVVASANATSGIAPLSIAFTASANGGWGTVRFIWTFGDSGGKEGPSVVRTYSVPGTYLVTVLAEDSLGASATATLHAEIFPPLVASASANRTQGDAPLNVTFTGSASGGKGPYVMEWDFGSGSSVGPATIEHSFLAAGNFTVKLTVLDAANNSAVWSALVVVTSPAVPGTDNNQTAPPNGSGKSPGFGLSEGMAALMIGAAASLLLVRRRRAAPPRPPIR